MPVCARGSVDEREMEAGQVADLHFPPAISLPTLQLPHFKFAYDRGKPTPFTQPVSQFD